MTTIRDARHAGVDIARQFGHAPWMAEFVASCILSQPLMVCRDQESILLRQLSSVLDLPGVSSWPFLPLRLGLIPCHGRVGPVHGKNLELLSPSKRTCPHCKAHPVCMLNWNTMGHATHK